MGFYLWASVQSVRANPQKAAYFKLHLGNHYLENLFTEAFFTYRLLRLAQISFILCESVESVRAKLIF
ncbi:hypothetical protein Aconfl_13830 [Algoriphagus confluentis]|uniref:Uncharacterized protein n=1 Tax=Algoriphagus confluentis TaxID=1697556 RepID=A0ABQ6PNF0_9BACT|nr:hypothetical protein Aconfl_13830 [Algoriphagus confluentis]